jgi:phosphoenolpyruvate carboxykinase (GTP)
MAPEEMKEKLNKLYDGCMKGRTMYVIPFCMGPLNSRVSKYGIEISDSAYVVVNMKIMTRMGIEVLHYIEENANKKVGTKPFLPCLHSVGKPLLEGIQWVSLFSFLSLAYTLVLNA